MLKIKLQRVGRRNEPAYRIVVTDSRTGPKSNKHVEIIGHFHPIQDSLEIKKDRAEYWLKQGVKPTDTVYNILVDQGIIEGKKKNVLPKKTPIIKEEEKQEEATA